MSAVSDATATTVCDSLSRCRSLYDIIWPCLTTSFACVWISIHPNVPPSHNKPNRNTRVTKFLRFLRRIRSSLVALVAPELMVGWAAAQWKETQILVRDYGLTTKQAYFLAMGGVVVQNTSGNIRPITINDLYRDSRNNHDAGLVAFIRQHSDADINDRSKSDGVSKCVVTIQLVWFIIQCVARAIEGLAITELEVSTVAIAVPGVVASLLWFSKPLAVTIPILFTGNWSFEFPGNTQRQEDESKWAKSLNSILVLDSSLDDLIEMGCVSDFYVVTAPEDGVELLPYGVACLTGVVFGAIHCLAWNFTFITVAEKQLWRTASVIVASLPAFIPASTLLLAAAAAFLIPTGFWNKMLLSLAKKVVEISGFLYCAARLTLLALVFAELRDLSPGIYKAIQWVRLIPHIN